MPPTYEIQFDEANVMLTGARVTPVAKKKKAAFARPAQLKLEALLVNYFYPQPIGKHF
jgi:hypothetical protein